jgi:hypothetical protein
MSSRSKMMGAGNASATIYNTNVNLNTFGGNKKQGITSRVGLDNWANVAVQTYSNGYGKNKLFCMNQLGGVGAGKSMFNGRFTQTDGVHCQTVPSVPSVSRTITLTNVRPVLLNPPMTFSSTSTNFVITIEASLMDCDPHLVTQFNIDGILYSVVSIVLNGGNVEFTFLLPAPSLPAQFSATVTCV